MKLLRAKSLANAKYRFLLNRYSQEKTQQSVERAFRKLKSYRSRRRYERIIVGKFKELRESTKAREALIKWALQYKKNAIKASQEVVADEICSKKRLEVQFNKWRALFNITVRKRLLKEKGEAFLR